MRFLFRGAFRSIARSPLQYIILFVTVVLSSLLFTMITETSFSIREESDLLAAAKYGCADIVVSAGGGADSSYIGSADIAAALDDGDSFSGYLVLPAYDDDGASLGAATDFETIGNIFSFSFTDYGYVTTENVNSAVFVSSAFAEERGLSVGDKCTVSVLGVSVEYVVQGINSRYFFGTYGFIVNVGGVLEILSDVSPVFTVFDADNLPYTRVYVRTDGDAEQKINSISAALSGTGWSAQAAAGSSDFYKDLIVTVFIPVAVIFTAVIAGVLVYFSLDIISRRRADETKNFILSGTSPLKVAAAFILETTVYVAAGTLLGIVLAGWILPVMAAGRYEYAALALTFRGAAVCAAAELAVELIASAAYFLRRRRTGNASRGAVRFALIAAVAVALVCAALAFVISVAYLYILSLIAAIAVIVLILAGVAPLCRGTEKVLAPAAEKSRRGVYVSLALKNCANTAETHNVLRILCVLLAVFVAVAACLSFMTDMVDVYSDILDCDFVVINADETVAEEIRQVDGTEDCCVCGIFEGDFASGVNFYLADVSDQSFIYGGGYSVSGNGVYLPKTYADLFGLSVGDEFTLTVSRVECVLTLSGYTNGRSIVGYFDADYFGLNNNMVLVRAESGGDYLSRLSQSVAVYGSFVQTFDSLFAAQINSVNKISGILNLYMVLMCTVAAIGAVNLVAVSYAARKKQFAALMLVGMSRRDIAAMIACEALIIAVIAIISTAILGAFACYLLNNGLRSFAFSLFG